MNILYLGDPSIKSHDLAWMKYFAIRNNQVFVIHRKATSKQIDQDYLSNLGIKLIGGINDFSLLRPYSTIKTFLFIKSVICKLNIDVFHILYAEPNALWALFKDNFKCKVGLTTRGTDILVTITQFSLLRKIQDHYIYHLYKSALKKFDFITCTSNNQKDKIEQITDCQVSPFIIRTGVNYTSIMKTASNYSVSIDGKYILFPRTMKPLYNHEFAIRSLKLLKSKIKSSYTFVFLDKDSDESNYVSSIQKLINQNTEIKIMFLNRLDEKPFYYLLKRASLMVITAKSDGSPVTAMEAMALGTPVILPPLNYDNDIFGDWIFKFDAWEEKKLASTITKVLNANMDCKIKMSKEIIFKYANYENEMTKLLKLYKS